MDWECDPEKDAINLGKHGVPLAFGTQIFDDVFVLIAPTIRKEDEEERYKAIGRVQSRLWTAIHIYRDTGSGLFRCGGVTLVNEEHMIAIPADPADPEDRAISAAALERAHMGRHIRQLRNRLGLSQSAFARQYGIPLANIRQYEIGRTMPPPAVRSFLKVIAAEPERAAAALNVA